MADERPDPEEPVGLFDGVEAGDPIDVDQARRGGETELHQRDQALTTGENLGVFSVFCEELKRFLERVGPVVLERCREHLVNPPISTGVGLRTATRPW